MTLTQLTALLVLILGPLIGSFLAVLADRLPRGEDVVADRSRCRACGTTLGVRDLVPLVSFAVTRGRCRHCHAPIPRWLPAMEIAATALALIAVLLGPAPAEMLLVAAFLWTLLALAAADLMWLRLPDVLTGTLLAVALALALVTGWPTPGRALAGAAIGAGSFLAIRLAYQALRHREGLGLGDVKLMAGLGAALGPFQIPSMVLMAALAALAVALVQRSTSPQALDAARPLPFGTALCAAGGLLWVLLRMSG